MKPVLQPIFYEVAAMCVSYRIHNSILTVECKQR